MDDSNIDPFETNDNYGQMVQVKLEQVIEQAPPQIIAKIMRRVVENLVIAERIAAKKGFDIVDQDRHKIVERDYPEIQAEVDRALGGVIGSILSREGG
jgi:hypothetical protein